MNFKKNKLNIAKNCFAVAFGICFSGAFMKYEPQGITNIINYFYDTSIINLDIKIYIFASFQMIFGSFLLFLSSLWIFFLKKEGLDEK